MQIQNTKVNVFQIRISILKYKYIPMITNHCLNELNTTLSSWTLLQLSSFIVAVITEKVTILPQLVDRHSETNHRLRDKKLRVKRNIGLWQLKNVTHSKICCYFFHMKYTETDIL